MLHSFSLLVWGHFLSPYDNDHNKSLHRANKLAPEMAWKFLYQSFYGSCKPSECRSALGSQQPSLLWKHGRHVLFCILQLTCLLLDRDHSGAQLWPTATFSWWSCFACCVHIRVQLLFHICPNKPSLAGENTFSFQTITPNVPGVKTPLSDEWWMSHAKKYSTLISRWLSMHNKSLLCIMWWAVVVLIKKVGSLGQITVSCNGNRLPLWDI